MDTVMAEDYEFVEVVKCDHCKSNFKFLQEYEIMIGEDARCPHCGEWFEVRKIYESMPKVRTLKGLIFSEFKSCFKNPVIIIAYLCFIFWIISTRNYDAMIVNGGLSGQHPFQLWRWVTHAFLHVGFWHMALNMLALVSFGLVLQDHIGKKIFIKLYALSMLSTCLFWITARYGNEIISIGASGAVFGIIGAYGMLLPNHKMIFIFFPMKSKTFIYVAFLISLLCAIFDNVTMIDHWSHLGGLIGGVLYMKYLIFKDEVYVEDKE
jgi:membrane associated rhomboid family serine protease